MSVLSIIFIPVLGVYFFCLIISICKFGFCKLDGVEKAEYIYCFIVSILLLYFLIGNMI